MRQIAARDYTPAQIRAWAPDAIDRAAWAAKRGSRPGYVADDDGVMLGFSDLGPAHEDGDGEIDMMFVHPDHQRRGVASALLAHIETEAMRRGMVRLHTYASLTAQPFFLRQGFTELETRQVALRGQILTNFHMRKNLPQPERETSSHH